MADNVVDILLRARMEAGDVASGISSIQKALNGLTLPKNVSGDLEKQFAKIGPLLKDYQKQLDKGFKTPKDLKNLELLKGKIADTFGEIKTKLQDVNGQEIRFKADTQEIAKLEKELDGLQIKLKDKLSNIYKSGQTEQGIKTNISSLEKALNSQWGTGKFRFPALKDLTSELRQALNTKDFVSFNNQIDSIRDKISRLSDSGKINIADSLGLKYAANDANAAGNAINTFLNKIQVSKTAASSIETLRAKIAETGTNLQQLKFDSATRGAEALGNASGGIDQLINSLSGVNQSATQAANGMLSMQQQVDQLKTSTQYFFSLRNMINLLKRGISQAVDTIKELDAAMTETAVVVPEWDVGDMWAKLPEYTKNANELGAKVVDLYKATTLYYQQGLRGNEVMDVAAETMKMARIGGLEAADATDKMTAALRGFNMEINQESAQRINDVYSNLAANTASNTEELGTAMQRTASIAASAGMSFEGTAAFLAQAIETTREPAENLGTAMKTIVARFTELKKNPLEITEVDGEEVSYNKVDTALQSIGVSLKDANGQFRNLDQVFLDISQRWDSLTQTQQRYIATQAAGSRQQSRFIAMMSNYQRTTELMAYANDSAGASQEQFEKTMDSLEAKMNKLKNAWDAFLMGITDNQIVKGAVDGLTTLVSGVNKLIDTLSLGVGPLKSFMSLMAAFTGLKIGGRFVNSMIGGLGGLVDPTSNFGAGFKNGMVGRGNPALASQIYNPIVAAIHELGAAMGHTFSNGSANSLFNKTADQIRYDAYKSAHQEFKNIAFNRGDYENKNATVNDLTKSLSKLDTKDQNLLGKAFFNTTNSARQATFQKWATQAFKFDKNAGSGHAAGQIYSKNAMQMLNQADKAIYADVKNNSLPLSEYFKRIQDPMTIKQALENTKGGTESPVYKYFDNLDKQGNDYAKSYIEKTNQSVIDKINNSSKLSQEQKDAAIKRWESTDHTQNARQAYFAKLRHEGAMPNGGETFQNSGVGKALDHISGFGSSMASAGMGLRSFGSLLQQSANPALATFGTALTTMGSLLSGIGMGVTGLTSAFSSASASIATATGMATGAAAALTAGLFGLVAVIGLAIAAENKRREDIKKRAEEITTNYKDKTKKTTSNISDLQSWESDMPRLAKGVDKNGNNINLDASDYQHYLEIVDRIAELNPEIVKGYNAQGHAIVDNNTALQKTLDLQKKNQKQAIKEYTSDESINALVAARDLNKVSGGYIGGKRTVGGKYSKIEYRTDMLAPQKEMMQQAKKMAQSLTKAGLSNEDFKDFGIDLSALEQGSQAAINALSNNIDKIKARAKTKMEELGDEVSDSTKKAFDKSASGFTDAASELDEMVTPLYEAISTKMASSGLFQNIPEEMTQFYNRGLKQIVSNVNLSGNEIQSQARKLGVEFENLVAKGGDYDRVMSDIAEAQEAFGDNLDASAYQEAADTAVSSLNKIKDGVDSTTSYGQALTEFLDNQIAQISNFTEEGAVSVTEALNTMTDRIGTAEGALESFQKVAEGSNFSTAAEGMKEIYNTITEKEDNKANKHAAGFGDQTYWAGAENVFGRDNLKGKSKADVDKMLADIKPMMDEDGEKAAAAFYNKWTATRKELEKIDGLKLFKEDGWLKSLDADINPDVYKQVADALGMSEEMLTSMLNNARQFTHINFSNLDKVRQGLATSDQVIEGQSSKGNKKRLYIKESALNAEFAQAGITSVNEQEKKAKELETNQNIVRIAEAAKISISQFKDMGIQTQKELITVFGDTGQFTKEEIQQYAEKFAELNGEEFLKDRFNSDFKNYQALSDPVQGEQLKTLDSLDSTVISILHQMQSDEVTSGKATDFKGDDLIKNILGGKGMDTAAQFFSQGYKYSKNKKERNYLTPEEYHSTYQALGEDIKTTSDYLDQLKVGQTEAQKNGDTEQAKKYAEAIKKVEYALEKLTEYRDSGEKVHNNILQSQVDTVNKAGFNGKNGKVKIKTDSIDSVEKEEALQNVYNASLNRGSALTSELFDSMKTLGINVKKAIQDGFITDPNGIYKKLKKESEKDKKASENGTKDGNKRKSSDTKKVEENAKTESEKDKKASGKGNTDGNKRTPSDTKTIEDAAKDGAKKDKKASGNGNKKGNTGGKGGNNEGASTSTTPPSKAATRAEKENRYNQSGEQKNTVTTEFRTEDKQLQNTEERLNRVTRTAKKGATVKITSKDNLATTQKKLANMEKKTAQNLHTDVKVTSTGDTKGVSTISNAAKKGATVPVKANVDTARSQVNSLLNEIRGKTATVNIKPNFGPSTSWEQAVRVKVKVTGGKVSSTGEHENTRSEIRDLDKKNNPVSTGGRIGINNVIYRAKGGSTLYAFIPEGTDTVPAMLTPGEYVQRKQAVDYFGDRFMQNINHLNLKGALNSLPKSQLLGSMANGSRSHGTIGPKNRGGLTLTGEEGYEVAWIPSQNRSMIVGVQGPEMLDLPGDTVVWNHEQSKKIVKKNNIPSGSAAIGAGSVDGETVTADEVSKALREAADKLKNGTKNAPKNPQNSKNKNKENKGGKTSKEQQKVTSKAGKTVAKFDHFVSKGGKLVVWWENISRKVENITRQISYSQKEFEKTLNKVGQTIDGAQAGFEELKKNLTLSIKNNQEIFNKYVSDLYKMTGKGDQEEIAGLSADQTKIKSGKQDARNNLIEKYNNQSSKLSQLRATREALGGKGSKKARRKLRKRINAAKKDLKATQTRIRNNDFTDSATYDDTAVVKVTTTKGKGKKKKKTTKKVKQQVKRKIAYDTNKLINYDEATGTYTINEKELNKIGKGKGKGGKKAREAVRDKVQKQIDDANSRKNAAEDKIREAAEAATKAGEDIYQAFWGWKNELTEIADITQKIAQINKQIESSTSHQSMLQAILESGTEAFGKFGDLVQKEFDAFTAELYETSKAINDSAILLQKQKENALSNAQVKSADDEMRRDRITGLNNQLAEEFGVDLANLDKAIENFEAGNVGQLDANKVAKVGELLGERNKLQEDVSRREQAASYFDWKQNPNTGEITYTIDWKQLAEDQKAGKTDLDYQAITDFEESIKTGNDSIYETTTDIYSKAGDIANRIKELKEQYADRADELLELYQNSEQAKIDRLKTLNDSIVNSLKDLFDEVRVRLDARRQQEDNVKTEQDINKKQNRLATLQADTSGGHAVEIAQLQQEIADAQQNYGRTLEDQLLDKLTKQGDIAQKQRERQIALLQAQRDVSKLTGLDVKEIQKWLSDPNSFKNIIETLWKADKNYVGSTGARQDLLDTEWNLFFKDIGTAETEGSLLSKQGVAEQAAKEAAKSVGEVSGANNANEKQIVPDAFKEQAKVTAAEVAQKVGVGTQADVDKARKAAEEAEAKRKADAAAAEAKRKADEAAKAAAAAEAKRKADEAAKAAAAAEAQRKAKEEAAKQAAIASIQKRMAQIEAAMPKKVEAYRKEYDNYLKSIEKRKKYIKNTENWTIWQNKAIQHKENYQGYANDAKRYRDEYDELLKQIKQLGGTAKDKLGHDKVIGYKTGGLNTQTGPAWLDGTRAKPELVLNAVDTKNFIALKDILSNVMGGINSANNTSSVEGAPVTYDININVDHLNNDYDVDRVAKRVEKLIVKNANYRNVTSVRNLR